MEKQGVKPSYCFIDKTDELNLHKIMPSLENSHKPAFSAGSYQTEVFELQDVQKINTDYKNSSKELLLQEFMPEIQTLRETSYLFFNKKNRMPSTKLPAGD
jgi:hypothetical protein